MELTVDQKIWKLIKDENTAVLVTVGKDGSFDSRPLGCAQKEFDGTLWFLTPKESPKLLDVDGYQHALISYTRPLDRKFVSVSGRVRIVESPAQVRTLWNEALRVWFPDGPASSNIALVAIDVEVVKLWIKPASYTYYFRAQFTEESPSRSQIAKRETIRTFYGVTM
jgi:general stress protein 26